jgi:hypothetical protein
MNMETAKKRHIFLALVPHRDTRLVLRRYSESLFRQGYGGAYHFPWTAPLAELSSPLTPGELKDCARAARAAAGSEKIRAAEAASVPFAAGGNGVSLFGARLDLAIPPAAFGSKAVSVFSPPVIGACLLENGPLPSPPELSFRAAAVANMFWQPAHNGYKWKIGKLFWLPKELLAE